MSLTDLSASISINGSSIAGYIRKVSIRGALCAPGAVGTIIMAPNYPLAIDPGQSVSVSLAGTLVFTGSVTEGAPERPSHDVAISIADEYLRVSRYFNPGQLTTENIASASSIIGQILSPTGISYSIEAPDVNVPPGIQVGLRHAHEALQDVMAYMTAYAFCDPDGTLVIRTMEGGTEHTYTTGITRFVRTQSDEMTRNVIKVFGAASVGPFISDGGPIFASASVDKRSLGLPVDKTAAVGSSLIETTAEAQRVANYLIAELGRLDDVVEAEMVGDATVQIGDFARFQFRDYAGSAPVTTLSHMLDENGFTTTVVTGQKCPRIAGWSRYTVPVYAGTSGSGIFRSTDGGITWTDFNTGLTGSSLYCRRIAANLYGELMSIVNGRLYYHNGTQWGDALSLGTPSNDAGDVPAHTSAGRLISVVNGGLAGEFWVLSTNGNTSGSVIQRARTWIWHTKDMGETWESNQITSSGSGYHCIGYDMCDSVGTPYAVVSSGSLSGGIATLSLKSYIRLETVIGPITCVAPGPNVGEAVSTIDVWAVTQTGTSPTRQLLIDILVRGGSLVSTASCGARSYYSAGYDALTPRRYTLSEATQRSFPVITSGGGYAVRRLTINESDFGSVVSFRIDVVCATGGGSDQWVGEPYCDQTNQSFGLNALVGSWEFE